MWEGDTYEDELGVLKKDGIFPPCRTGLTSAAGYDLQQLIRYSFVRIGEERFGRRVVKAVIRRIDNEHTHPCLERYIKQWAQKEVNLRFLQWLICEELALDPSSTAARIQAEVIDYLTMELTGKEYRAPE